jgi:hypothetical protein
MQTNKQSIAIYHIVKTQDNKIHKRIQGEARIADKYIEDVETKFEYMLFNAPKNYSYMDLFIFFRSEWERIVRVLQQRNFQYIRINTKHFDNLYAPIKL